jgi:hypothetical protein
MRYVTLSTEELEHLRDGLKVIESLNEYGEPVIELWLFALTDNLNAMDAVKESIAYWSDAPEEEVDVAEAVIIIPCSTDTLYYLTGSGLILRKEEAVYAGGSEGPRNVTLHSSGIKVTIQHFKKIAVARDDYGADEFLKQYGTKTQAAPQEVKRTEPSTTPTPGTNRATGELMPMKESSEDINSVLDQWL